VRGVAWYEAAAYCNWLSEQEGIPKAQWCYEANDKGQYAAGMRLAPNCLQRTGYRLPTEAEWEYCCRAGAVTRFSFGEAEELLGKYAWYGANSDRNPHPVGVLMPNDLGLFDMHGNVAEWCLENDGDSAYVDKENHMMLPGACMYRGGSFIRGALNVRSANRLRGVAYRAYDVGFRPARTLAP
jgi:formylglycine-generating enzyme required for sulfatase activity